MDKVTKSWSKLLVGFHKMMDQILDLVLNLQVEFQEEKEYQLLIKMLLHLMESFVNLIQWIFKVIQIPITKIEFKKFT